MNNRRSFIVSILAVGGFIATSMLIPSVGTAQVDKVKASMAGLKAKTGKLGAPKIEGKAPVAGKDALPCISARPRRTTPSTWSMRS
jgi:hypothetical protein